MKRLIDKFSMWNSNRKQGIHMLSEREYRKLEKTITLAIVIA